MREFSRLFVGTAYVQGLYNTADQFHHVCLEALPIAKTARQLFTTEVVLMEIGNAFASIQRRIQGAKIIREFLTSSSVKIIHLSPKYFEQALRLYEQRSDKNWGMTDCLSFTVMQKLKLHSCLTTDHHFSQAGFTILPF